MQRVPKFERRGFSQVDNLATPLAVRRRAGLPEPEILVGQRVDPIDRFGVAEIVGQNRADRVSESAFVQAVVEFDGVYDYVSTPFVLNPDDGPLSVFAWIRGGAPGQVIISQTTAANWLLADPADGELMTELKSSGRFGGPLFSQAVITDGDWHRVGLTWDGSTRILFVDDVEVAKDTQAGLAPSDRGLNIGAGKNPTAGSFWSGLIDDIRIYDRAIVP